MHQSKKDARRPFFVGGMLATALLAASQLLAQSAGNIVVSPPIQTKGTAQAAIVGFTPSQVRHAYGFDQIANQGAGQTIAVIEAFGDLSIEKDLATFDDAFGLPPCTTSNGCLQIVSSNGRTQGQGQVWSLETALDVEWVHALVPQAKIMIVQAPSAGLDDMVVGVDRAVALGATVVSMSWRTATEFVGETAYDFHFANPNIVFVAGSGDCGSGTSDGSCTGTGYPSVSPYVLSVGGTSLSTDASGNYLGEVAWSGSGGGLSLYELEPPYQVAFPIPNDSTGTRGTPDVSYNADPDMGFAVYTTVSYQGFSGWIEVGGTSGATPQWGALLAIARSMGWSPTASGTNAAIYAAASRSTSYARNYHDITAGSNDLSGTCGTLCAATTGYDFVTGIGTPNVPNLINALLKSR